MARYIDADKFIERLKASPAFPNMGMDGCFLLDVVENLLKNFPTADVAPKSEVEKYAQIHNYIFETITEGCDYETREAYERAYNKELSKLVDSITTKSEVAREIFEEIEREIVAALDSNYRAKSERMANPKIDTADELISWCEGKISALRGIEGFVEELKKKYTEGKT